MVYIQELSRSLIHKPLQPVVPRPSSSEMPPIGANTHRLMTVVVIRIGIAVYPVQLPLFGLGVSLLGCQLSPVLSCFRDDFERQECLSLPPFPLKRKMSNL